MTYPVIRAREAYQKMQEGAMYLDVRTPEEFQAGHAKGAVNIPLMFKGLLGLKPNPEFTTQVEAQIPKATKLVIGCAVGGRSARACELLSEHGYAQVANIDGGFVGKNDPATGDRIKGWKEEGLPVE